MTNTGGKGSGIRPSSVSREQFANNWDNIFKKKESRTLVSFLISVPRNKELYIGTGFYIKDDCLVDYHSQKIIAKKYICSDLDSDDYEVDVKTLLEVLDAELVYEEREFFVYAKNKEKCIHHLAQAFEYKNRGILKWTEISLYRNIYNVEIYKEYKNYYND